MDRGRSTGSGRLPISALVELGGISQGPAILNAPSPMVDEHPFQQLFESFGRYPVAHAEAVNREAGEALRLALSVPLDHAGRCILLKAPRAGHGKTHLLTRVQHHLGATHEF